MRPKLQLTLQLFPPSNLQRYSKLEIMICTKRKDLKFLAKNVRVFHSLEDALKEKPDIGFITNQILFFMTSILILSYNI